MSTCIRCGKPLPEQHMGRPRVYCSQPCRDEVRQARRDLDHLRAQVESATRLADATEDHDPATSKQYRATAAAADASYRAAADLVAAADAVTGRT